MANGITSLDQITFEPSAYENEQEENKEQVE